MFPANTQLAIGTSPEISSMTRILESNEAEINDIEWVRHAVPFTVDSEGNYHFSYRIMNLVPVQFYKFRILEVPQHDLAARTTTRNIPWKSGTTDFTTPRNIKCVS